jgi:hypothetical protein
VSWQHAPEALDLLETTGNGFDGRSFREAFVGAMPNWRDTSFGAVSSDGTRAAVALLASQGTAESVPLAYGGIVATRALNASEAVSFVTAARTHTALRSVRVRAVAFDGLDTARHLGGSVTAWTRCVPLAPGVDPRTLFSKKALQSIRRAERAGCILHRSNDCTGFVAVCGRTAPERLNLYDPKLLDALAKRGLVGFYDVELDGDIVSSLAAVKGARQWMYWLAAQDERGRGAEAGYLGVGQMLVDAHAGEAAWVNLGASTDLEGVDRFKRRFGALPTPVLVYSDDGPLTWAARVRVRIRSQSGRR